MAVGVRGDAVAITKPRTDKREYRRIVLDNSLEVLLISDPDTDKCAASMNVGIGAFSDPEGLEGLAHFLEHMLFYASEKYPQEDSYSKYISEHGGSTNAFTSSEKTNYHFEVNSDSFEEALDRFAQFFIKPLMSSDATMREIKAVDSEHQKNLLSDPWRMNQLQKHLSAEDHPYHKFSTGSWDTLEVRPKARGIDTRQELLKFYEENYSANLMHLVIYSKDSLDKSEKMVQSKFQEIRNIDRTRPCFTGQPCTPEHLQILVKTAPIKKGHKLRVVWPMTSVFPHYKEGPSRYLVHLIGHEGEGSLFFSLKKLGWASSLYAGESESNFQFSFFEVGIDLTDAGHEHVEDILGLLFKYILLLQQAGPCKWIFDELSAICETDFHYRDKIQPINYVVSVAKKMQLYPPEDWLIGSSLPSKFNSSIIQSFLNELTPSSVRIFWESSSFQGHTDLTEPWYGTEFSVEKIDGSLIQKWIEQAPAEDLHLPAANIFIPTDLSLKSVEEKTKLPTLLRKSPYSRLWYKPDTTFSSPKAFVVIDFNCPLSGTSPESLALTDVFTRLLMDYLNEYAYHAQVAGLNYNINNTDSGFQVMVFGYNHKLSVLLEAVLEKIAKFEVKPDRFYVIKELMTKEYENIKFQQPYQQALYYCNLMLRDQTWHWNDVLELLPHIEPDHLLKFYPLMLSRTFLECYVAGNIEPAEAQSIIKHVEDIFYNGPQPISKALFASQHSTNRVVRLGKGKKYIYEKEGLNPTDENSTLLHHIQVHQDDFLQNVKLQLFVLMAKQATFHQLRTIEQLGYITALLVRNDSGVRGLQFIIQSAAKDPKHIDSRVEEFLKTFENKLYEMTDDEFKGNVTALIDVKLEKHKNLREESRFFWTEISDGTLKFDRREHEVESLKGLSKKDLIEFFDENIKIGAPQKKSLSIRVYGSSHIAQLKADENEAAEENSVRVGDIFSFRRSHELYGSFKGGVGFMKL